MPVKPELLGSGASPVASGSVTTGPVCPLKAAVLTVGLGVAPCRPIQLAIVKLSTIRKRMSTTRIPIVTQRMWWAIWVVETRSGFAQASRALTQEPPDMRSAVAPVKAPQTFCRSAPSTMAKTLSRTNQNAIRHQASPLQAGVSPKVCLGPESCGVGAITLHDCPEAAQSSRVTPNHAGSGSLVYRD
jgi:hypothetical protein